MNILRNKLTNTVLINARKTDFLQISKANQSQFTGYLKHVFAATLLNLVKANSFIRREIQGKKPVVKELPKDTVIIYQFPRGVNTPSLSPFCLKLETWCRAANIKYENRFGITTSSRGTVPFIRLNDYLVEDSQHSIEYLSRVFQVDLNSHLSSDQKSKAQAILALVENSLIRSMVLHRFWYSSMKKQETGLPLLSIWYFSYKMYRAQWYAGYAKYTKQEIYERGKRDLTALNNLIGNKKFLFSDTKPCDVDIAIFGLCAQIKYNDRGPLNQHLLSECHNLDKHINTIKSLYWQDWDQNLLRRKPSIKKPLVTRILSLVKK